MKENENIGGIVHLNNGGKIMLSREAAAEIKKHLEQETLAETIFFHGDKGYSSFILYRTNISYFEYFK